MAYYWYQSDPQLYQMEVAAMKKFFPSFTINQLQDGSGRLYWRGKVQPTGEGGMVLTDDADLAKRMKELRTHGSTVSADARHQGKGFLLPEFNEAGYNYRMTDIQGAVGLAQAEKFDYIIEEKRKKATLFLYRKIFSV